jgi:hypothetical protein
MAARSLTLFFSVLSDISLLSEDLFQKLIALKNPLRVGFSSSGIATVIESALLLLPKSLEKRFDFACCFSSLFMIKGSVFFRNNLVRVDLFVGGTFLASIIGVSSAFGAALLLRTLLLETDEFVLLTQQQLALRRKNAIKTIATKNIMSPTSPNVSFLKE